MSANNYHPSVAPVKGNATTHLKATEAVGRVPFIDYKLPRADHDIANTRNSFRKRDNTITNVRSAGEAQTIKLKIPECVKTLVPGETTIRITAKLKNWDSTTFLDGGIQRIFRRLIIRDGHGVELENIERYNRVSQTLFDVHVPEHIKYTAFQQEGIYKYEVPAVMTGPKMHWNNSASVPWNAIDGGTGQRKKYFSVDNMALPAITKTPAALTDFSRYVSWSDRHFDIKKTQEDLYNSIWTASHNGTTNETYRAPVNQLLSAESTGDRRQRGIELQGNPLTAPDLTAAGSNSLTYEGHCCYTPWFYHIGQKWYENAASGPDEFIGVGSESKEITFTFHPTASGILSSTKHIPLWIFKGLEIELEIDRPTNYLRDARAEFENTATSFLALPDSNKPYIEVTRAEVLWTGVDLTEKMINAINRQYDTSGLHFCFPSFLCEERDDFTNQQPNQIWKLEFKKCFAMLNRVYSNASTTSDTLSEWAVDTFNTVNHKPTQRSWEYNRIYRPDWGTDLNVEDIDHFYQTKKSLGVLHDYQSNNLAYGDYQSQPTLGRKLLNYQVDEFETEPSGFLTGIDTNNEKMIYRFRPTNGAFTGERFFFTWHYYKLAVYRRGEPVFIKS